MTKKKVVMLVNNNGIDDSRVVKQAEHLAQTGYQCVVLCLLKDTKISHEVVNGVEYKRFPFENGFFVLVSSLFPFLKFFLLRRSARRTVEQKISVSNDVEMNLTFVAKVFRFAKARATSVVKLVTTRVQRVVRNSIKKLTVAMRLKLVSKTRLGTRILMNSYSFTFYQAAKYEAADAYHSHELWVLEASALAAREVDAHLIYDSHELEAHRNNLWSKTANEERIAFEERYIHYAKKVMAVSPGCADQLGQIYDLDEVVLLRNTPRINNDIEISNVREQIGITEDTKLLLYVGLVTINRGVELILAAMKQLDQCHLALVGPASEVALNKILELADDYGLRDRVHLMGKKHPDGLVEYISTADISILPIRNVCISYEHCLPNKLFESICAGIPVVATDLPDMAKVIRENGVGQVFEDGNVDDLVSVIESVLEHPRREDMDRLADLRRLHSFVAEGVVLDTIYSEVFG
jgi:glycosyltransferase involved in cell wall biosynthesis